MPDLKASGAASRTARLLLMERLALFPVLGAIDRSAVDMTEQIDELLDKPG